MVNTPPAPVAVLPDSANDPGLVERARQLATRLGLPHEMQSDAPVQLVVTAERLELRTPGEAGTRPVYVDLLAVDVDSPFGRSKKSPLARAVGLGRWALDRPMRVVDATAGMGEDAWVLAALGCEVTAIERSALAHALLEDGLRRAAAVRPEIGRNIKLLCGDSAKVLNQIDPRPDVVVLDPMFPARRKSALEKRPMRVLRQVVGGDADAQRLFECAMAAATRRVVVKRPRHADPLGGQPTASHSGRAMRFDVYGLG